MSENVEGGTRGESSQENEMRTLHSAFLTLALIDALDKEREEREESLRLNQTLKDELDNALSKLKKPKAIKPTSLDRRYRRSRKKNGYCPKNSDHKSGSGKYCRVCKARMSK
jgi:hypothetical protein